MCEGTHERERERERESLLEKGIAARTVAGRMARVENTG